MEVIQQEHEIPDFLTEEQMVAIADDLIKIIMESMGFLSIMKLMRA